MPLSPGELCCRRSSEARNGARQRSASRENSRVAATCPQVANELATRLLGVRRRPPQQGIGTANAVASPIPTRRPGVFRATCFMLIRIGVMRCDDQSDGIARREHLRRVPDMSAAGPVTAMCIGPLASRWALSGGKRGGCGRGDRHDPHASAGSDDVQGNSA